MQAHDFSRNSGRLGLEEMPVRPARRRRGRNRPAGQPARTQGFINHGRASASGAGFRARSVAIAVTSARLPDPAPH